MSVPPRDDVKSEAVLYTPERMAIARENAQQYEWAREERDRAISEADACLQVPIEQLLDRMPTPNMVRSMTGYCPHCGWETMGTAGQIDIFSSPWRTVCPSCSMDLPGFDAEAYFLSGKDDRGWFKEDRADASLLPEDAAFREVARKAMESYSYQYWVQFCRVLPELALASAYTDETKYGHYALMMLARLADFYPHFRREDTRGDTHPGGMVQDGWEASCVERIVLAYDILFSLASDPGLLGSLNAYRAGLGHEPLSDGKEVQRHIEERIFGVIAEDRFDGHYIGYGPAKSVMRRIWNANAHRAHAVPETIGLILGDTSLGRQFQEEAERLPFRGFCPDGSNVEGATSYDLGGFRFVTKHYGEVMRFAPDPPANVWEDKTVQAAYHLYFDLFCLGRFYPHFGDAGTCGAPNSMFSASDRGTGHIGRITEANRAAAREYAQVYRATGIDRFAVIAWHLNGEAVNGLHLSEYDPEPEAIRTEIRAALGRWNGPVERSFVAPDLGFAMLKSGRGGNRRALWMRANRRNQTSEAGWHGHSDSMEIGLFGHGLNLVPDLGYMDQKIWVFGHNTVSLQPTAVPRALTTQDHFGDVEGGGLPLPILSEVDFMARFPGLQVARCRGIGDEGSYRTTFLVDVDREHFYVVDSFRVAPSEEGEYATYSFHTNQGEVATSLDLAESEERIEGRSRMLGQWVPPMWDASAGQAGHPWWAEVALEDTYNLLDRPYSVKVRFTSLRPADRAFHTHYAPPLAEPVIPKRIPYFFLSVAKPDGHDTPRRFTSIIEPHTGTRPVRSARILSFGSDSRSEFIEVVESSGRTLLFFISDGKQTAMLAEGFALQAQIAVIIREDGEISRICLHGGQVRCQGAPELCTDQGP